MEKIGSPIYPEQDIRQGDPLSSSIFIISVEYLHRYIHFATTCPKSNIGIKLNKDCPNILYLMFVDDCLIFCRAIRKVAKEVVNIFDHYC